MNLLESFSKYELLESREYFVYFLELAVTRENHRYVLLCKNQLMALVA